MIQLVTKVLDFFKDTFTKRHSPLCQTFPDCAMSAVNIPGKCCLKLLILLHFNLSFQISPRTHMQQLHTCFRLDCYCTSNVNVYNMYKTDPFLQEHHSTLLMGWHGSGLPSLPSLAENTM